MSEKEADAWERPMTAPAGRRLREALGSFVTGVTVITARDAGGAPQGLTANSFSSVSLEPPLVLFSLARTADCFAAFESADAFGVNVLRSEQEALSGRFATKEAAKWDGVGWRPGYEGCPLLNEALATFECRVTARHEGGDHVIYVGEVVRFAHEPQGEPLVFFRGRYAALDGPSR